LSLIRALWEEMVPISDHLCSTSSSQVETKQMPEKNNLRRCLDKLRGTCYSTRTIYQFQYLEVVAREESTLARKGRESETVETRHIKPHGMPPSDPTLTLDRDEGRTRLEILWSPVI